ncbi:MAG: VWA domain-containing protein [Akkermansiaceae bacterium]|nr:VWA domain-containing protein [Akkermansiaceae bacterium]MCF7734508.1 VWA domain-containing protein [Akkermansiaceae bacterium]
MKSIAIIASLAAVLCVHAADPGTPATPEPTLNDTTPQAAKPVVDVVFVLDSTGSMSGLIEGAKEKIWSIANSVISQQPRPVVRIGLVSYRDRKDEYVTKKFDLTDDIDTVFKNLRSLKAGGGGDTPESVNQALDEAVTSMKWSDAKDSSKIIFLVGDCPPHMDYQDDVKYPVTCKTAATSGIIINTVQCGGHGETTPVWQEIAKLAEGTYVALAQTGGMVAMTTPHDGEIAKLSAALGETSVAYGSVAQQISVREKNTVAKDAAPAVAASRAAFNTMTGGKAIQGRGDLVADLADGSVKLESVKEEELPPEMKKMTEPERKAYLEEQQAKRSTLNKQLDELVRQRADFIEQEKARLAKEGKGDSFDLKVEETIKEQVKRTGKK